MKKTSVFEYVIGQKEKKKLQLQIIHKKEIQMEISGVQNKYLRGKSKKHMKKSGVQIQIQIFAW